MDGVINTDYTYFEFDKWIKYNDATKKLTKEILLEIEGILGNVPKGEIDYRDWAELPSRRNINLGVDFKKGGPFN